MNNVVLMGRLVRDPDVRYTQGQQPMAVARYTLAVGRRGRKQDGQQTADFISCIAFGKSGEFAEKHLRKGTKICVSGRIQTGSYTKQDGAKVYTTDVVVDNQEFAESKNAQGVATGYGESVLVPKDDEATASALDGFMSLPDEIDEELPFS